MSTDAMQKYGAAVQQNVSASRLDAAEADEVAHLICLCFDRYVVELRTLRRPQLQIRIKIDFNKAAIIRGKGFTDPRLGDSNRDSLPELFSIQFHPTAHAFA